MATLSVVAVTGMFVGVVWTSVTVIGLKDVVELEAVVVSMVDGNGGLSSHNYFGGQNDRISGLGV